MKFTPHNSQSTHTIHISQVTQSQVIVMATITTKNNCMPGRDAPAETRLI